ncbi:MAG: hypothetical protein II800_00085 [Lachnospiraceae bacterium]|nr:hypothetical protein [Lachnospiraceae bacterium]
MIEDTLKQLYDEADTMAGNVPKALLFVRERNTQADYDDAARNEVNTSVKALRELTQRSSNKGIAAALKDVPVGQVMNADATTAMQKKASGDEIRNAFAAQKFRAMKVQYNPSSLRFRTSAGSFNQRQGLGDESIQQQITIERAPETVLQVQLLFDQTNVYDAFISSNLDLGVGNAVAGAADLLGGDYSVREPVEALVSLLLYKETKQVVFYWSSMYFHGELSMVDVNYTMFNKKGNPIRAQVNLEILQSDSALEYLSDREYWDSAFNEAFGEAGFSVDTDASEDIVNVISEKFGNLFG